MHMASTNHVQASVLLALESALPLFLVLINETRMATAARLISVCVCVCQPSTGCDRGQVANVQYQ